MKKKKTSLSPTARPIAMIAGRFNGKSPAQARMPSIPNYFIFIDSELIKGFFFFQAEDGIRDYKVTGVQPCALPIFDDDLLHLRQPVRDRLRTYPGTMLEVVV